jgi:hypothetical protein
MYNGGAIPPGYGSVATGYGPRLIMPVSAAAGQWGAYGASAKRCAKLLARIEKRESKGSRWSTRRASKLRSKYIKKGCEAIVPNGASALNPAAAQAVAVQLQQEQAAQAAAFQTTMAQASGGEATGKPWLLGGAAVLAVLAVAWFATKE